MNMSDETPDDRITITVSLVLKGNDHNQWPDEYAWALPAGEEMEDELRDLADAIEDGRVFGFMMQRIAECTIGADEWSNEEETITADDRSIPPHVVHFRASAKSEDYGGEKT